jgi:cysteine synthase
VNEEEARNMANRLCQEECIYCGMSSGANVYVTLKIAQRLKKIRMLLLLLLTEEIDI